MTGIMMEALAALASNKTVNFFMHNLFSVIVTCCHI
jgi:hypothetical protein